MPPDDSPTSMPPSGAPPQRTTGGGMKWTPPSPEHLQRTLPAYEVISILGQGGMGAVYQARQRSLDRMVAIKIIPPEAADDEAQFIARFQNEARTMAKMNHPAIVGVYDFGETSEGQLYFAMEFVDGTDVAKMIKDTGKLPPDHALAITAHVCDALQYAHHHGVIHRDIKPANILINHHGQVKVADFGLAKLDDPSLTSGLTKSNVAMGTPDFVAPEMLALGTVVDHRADLYAIGVMLYQMLTGEIPRGMFKMPSQKAGVDPRFDAVIRRAMESDPEARYQSAQEIRQDLDRMLTPAPAKEDNANSQQAAAVRETPAQRSAPRAPAPSATPGPAQTAAATQKKLSASLAYTIVGALALVALAFVLLQFGKKPTPPQQVQSGTPIVPTISTSKDATPVAKLALEASPEPVLPAPFAEALPQLSEKAVEVLAAVDPAQDRVEGDWVFENEALVYAKKSGNRSGLVGLPLLCSASYIVDLELSTPSGSGEIALHLPIAKEGGTGHDDIALVVHQDNKGDHRIDFASFSGGKREKNSPSSKAPKAPTEKSRLTIRIDLRPGNRLELGVWKDTQPVLGWQGPRSAFSGSPTEWRPKAGPRFALGTNLTGTMFHRVRIEALDGAVQWLRGPTIARTAPVTPPMQAASPAPAVPPPPQPTLVPAPNPTPATPAADPVSLKLAELEKTFLDAYEKQAEGPHKRAVADLNAKFIAALDRSIATVSQAGKLEEGLALQGEREQLRGGGTVPDEDAEDAPASLKALRKTYRSQMAVLIANRDRAAAPLHAGYDRLLAGYQDELTRASKLDGALRVKAVREYLSSQREGSTATTTSSPPTSAVASAPAMGTSGKVPLPTAPPLPASKILPPPPKATPEEVRALCEWALGKGGNISVVEGSGTRKVDSIAKLPKSKFSLASFYVYEMAMDEEGKKWLRVLGGCPDLEELSFHKNPGLFPLEELRGLAKLRTLTIMPTTVEDASFAHLTGLKSLEQLSITYYLKEFDGSGLGYINDGLVELKLNAATLTAEGLAYLPRFKKLKRLSIYGEGVGTGLNTSLKDAMLRGLSALSALEELTLTSTPLDGSFLAYLPQNSKLKRLDLAAMSQFNPEHLKHLAKLKNLEQIDMPPVNPSPEVLSIIANLDLLRELAFLSNPVFTVESFRGLKGFKGLKRLNLHICPINDAALEAVSLALPGLTSMELTNAANNKATMTVGGFSQALARLQNLTSLQIHGERTTDAWLPAIAQLKALDYLMLTGAAVTDQGLVPLMKLPLGYLRLDGTLVTDGVLPVLRTCPTLNNVPVGGTKMTDAGKAELKRMLDAP